MEISTVVMGTVIGGAVATLCTIAVIEEIDAHKKRIVNNDIATKKAELDREIKEQKAKDDKERLDKELRDKEHYWESLSSEDKAAIEIEKEKTEQKRLETRSKEADARKAEAEMKSSVTKFKNDILTDVRKEALDYVKADSKDLFNTWVTTYQDKIDRKIEKLSDKLDDFADSDDLDSLERKLDRLSDKIDDFDFADDDDLKELTRKVSKLSDKIDDSSDIKTNGAPASPNVTIAPVISH